jgi:glycosyltransferase involved in cell wall biosynthesis
MVNPELSQGRGCRLLYMTPFAPRLDLPHGGRVTAALILRLAERHSLAVVCLRGPEEPGTDEAIRRVCQVVEEVERPERALTNWRNRVVQLGKLVGAPPTLVQRTHVSAYAKRLRAVAESFAPDLIQVEPHEMAQYLPSLPAMQAKRVLVDHDPGCEAAHDFSLATHGIRRVWRQVDEIAWRRYAQRTAAEIDAVVVFSDRDRRNVEAYAAPKPTVVIPFPVSLPEHPLSVRGNHRNRILFFGGYDHPPNADAALRLALSIFPSVRREHPESVLELVGEATDEIQSLAGDTVVVSGRVESMEPHLSRAAVVAVPIRFGGGMRVKVLESLAAGKAVVASPRAVEGLQLTSDELLLADTDEEFSAAISALLADNQQRVGLERAARRWAEQHFDPDRQVHAYEALYQRLLTAEA